MPVVFTVPADRRDCLQKKIAVQVGEPATGTIVPHLRNVASMDSAPMEALLRFQHAMGKAAQQYRYAGLTIANGYRSCDKNCISRPARVERWFCHSATVRSARCSKVDTASPTIYDRVCLTSKQARSNFKMDVPQSRSKILLLMVVPSLVHYNVPLSLRHDDGSHMLSMVGSPSLSVFGAPNHDLFRVNYKQVQFVHAVRHVISANKRGSATSSYMPG